LPRPQARRCDARDGYQYSPVSICDFKRDSVDNLAKIVIGDMSESKATRFARGVLDYYQNKTAPAG
jgi:hypothetical protein